MSMKKHSPARTWAQRAAAVGIVGAVALTGTAAAQAHDNGAGKARGSSPLSALVTAGTITAADVEAVKAALEADRDANKAEHQAEMKAARDAALASLVKAGTLTQSQADAIAAALDAAPPRGGKHGGSTDGKHGGGFGGMQQGGRR